MKITNETKTAWIELEKLDEDSAGYSYPCIIVGVRVKTNLLEGYFERLWVLIEGMDAFIEQLAELDQKRKGSAWLSSLHPEDFTLEIKALDANGHLAARIRLEESNATDPDCNHALQTGFEIDPTAISAIIVSVKKIKKRRELTIQLPYLFGQ